MGVAVSLRLHNTTTNLIPYKSGVRSDQGLYVGTTETGFGHPFGILKTEPRPCPAYFAVLAQHKPRMDFLIVMS